MSGSFGVLVSQPAGGNYTVSLIGTDGKVAASAQASAPAAVSCGNAQAGVVPLPVSTSNSALYFMDAQGFVRELVPNQPIASNPIVSLPIGPSRRSAFAVSPDNQEMAVVVIDFAPSGATTKLYIYQLWSGGSQVLTFTESGAYTLWPLGWHGNSIVLAKVSACTQGGGPLCCGPLELHVVDPSTAVRRLTIGGPDCVIASPPTPAGGLCESSAIDFKVYDWSGNLLKQEPSGLTSQASHPTDSTSPSPTAPRPISPTSMAAWSWRCVAGSTTATSSRGAMPNISRGWAMSAAEPLFQSLPRARVAGGSPAACRTPCMAAARGLLWPKMSPA